MAEITNNQVGQHFASTRSSISSALSNYARRSYDVWNEIFPPRTQSRTISSRPDHVDIVSNLAASSTLNDSEDTNILLPECDYTLDEHESQEHVNTFHDPQVEIVPFTNTVQCGTRVCRPQTRLLPEIPEEDIYEPVRVESRKLIVPRHKYLIVGGCLLVLVLLIFIVVMMVVTNKSKSGK